VSNTPRLSIVIPLKNEQDNVVPLIQEVQQAVEPLGTYEILAIDDGSTDNTWNTLVELKKTIPALRCLKHDRNHGQSAGLWTGLKNAVGEIIITMDGDRQNDPNDIPQLLAELEKGADVCLTYRANRQDSWSKKVQSKIGNKFRNSLLGSDIRDTGSQLRAFRADCIDNLPNFNGMHRFMGNLFLMGGFKLAQVPTHHRARVAGVSNYSMANRAFRGLKDVWGVRWLSQRAIRPKVAEEK
jgi:dolichol-phosphate mannosyltransferase